MSLFDSLFGSKKTLKITDVDFGAIESFFTKGNKVGWKIKKRFLKT